VDGLGAAIDRDERFPELSESAAGPETESAESCRGIDHCGGLVVGRRRYLVLIE
jgi:hypothetical protein